MNNRGQRLQLEHLHDSQAAGGYTLPPQLLQAVDRHRRALALEVPPVVDYTTTQAGADLLDRLDDIPDTGGPALTELADQVLAVDRAQRLAAQARNVWTSAVEQAEHHAITTAADLADVITTDHLRPALEDVYDQARTLATQLEGHDVTAPATLVTAPAKARTAFSQLDDLVRRRNVLFDARSQVRRMAGQQLEHDDRGLFGEFRDTLVLFPGLPASARVPDLPAPDSPLARLLWVVSTAQAAHPWFPTAAEQDARWWAEYGARITEHNQRNRQVRSMVGA